VPFIVAAPCTSIDMNTARGAGIEIEQRAANEITNIRGRASNGECCTVEIAAPGIDCWNPAFDVTPASLISAIATEKGIITKKDGVFDIKEFLLHPP
jgi:methylthioribose-1-phosphate isomerase